MRLDRLTIAPVKALDLQCSPVRGPASRTTGGEVDRTAGGEAAQEEAAAVQKDVNPKQNLPQKTKTKVKTLNFNEVRQAEFSGTLALRTSREIRRGQFRRF